MILFRGARAKRDRILPNVKAIRTDVLVDKAPEDLYPTWQKKFEQWKRVGGDHPYHYLGSAIWFNRIGKTMGDAMLDLLKAPN